MNHLRISELLRLARMRLSNDVNVVLAAGKTLENVALKRRAVSPPQGLRPLLAP